MLHYLQKVSSDIGISFAPAEFHVDLEMAMLNAIRQQQPTAKISLCQFHLAQAWFRSIQKNGLVNEYTNNKSEIGKWLKLLFGIPSLPPHEVELFFRDVILLCDPAPFAQTAPFLDYLEKNYMSAGSTYPPDMWARNDCEINTTNTCESFHRQLEYGFSSPHLSPWNFLSAIAGQHQKAVLKMICDKQLPTRQARRKLKEIKQYNITLYKHSTLTQYDFVKKISFCILPVRHL